MPISNRAKGFTLIELLVVISIIGMLSSVVLVSLQSARDKGRVGAGITFDTSMYHLFSATNAIVDYSFDDGAISPLTDYSGIQNSLTCSTALSMVFPPVSFNGQSATRALDLAIGGCSSGSFAFNGFDSTNGTISFWIYPRSYSGTNQYITAVKNQWVTMNASGNIVFNSLTSTGVAPLNKWSHVAVSWGAGTTNIYIDGRLSGSSGSLPNFIAGSNFYIGVFQPLDAILDQYRFYNKSPQSP